MEENLSAIIRRGAVWSKAVDENEAPRRRAEVGGRLDPVMQAADGADVLEVVAVESGMFEVRIGVHQLRVTCTAVTAATPPSARWEIGL